MRIFFKDGAGISELTNKLNKYKSGTSVLSITDTDALYVATDFPLNNFYVKMGEVLNEESSVMSISYWSGSSWVPTVNLNDYTSSFSESGFIEFTPNRQQSWGMSNSSSDGQFIPGLSAITVYDKYWIKIEFSATLSAGIELDWVGSLFTDDEDLFSEYPIFNDGNFLASFEAGKTTWQEQHVRAAEIIIADLIRKKVVMGREQILDRKKFIDASISKVAEIILNSFGNDYLEQRKAAKEEYSRRLDLGQYSTDLNNDGILDPTDLAYRQGWLSR
jgi:hypothetical protein